MTKQQADLHRFFSDKAKHLQNEIDWEIEKIGGKHKVQGEDMRSEAFCCQDQTR